MPRWEATAFSQTTGYIDVIVGLLRDSVSVDSDVAVQLGKEEAVFFGDGDSTVDLDVFGACLGALAERHGVEAFCNVDHVHLPDSFGFLETAVDSGLPDSLMVNASAESFKQNVGLTAEAVAGSAMASSLRPNSGALRTSRGPLRPPATRHPILARRTPSSLSTGPVTTCLPCPSARSTASIRPGLTADIDDALCEAGHDTPLVVHSALGLPDERIAELLNAGIGKFNKNIPYESAHTAADFYYDETPAHVVRYWVVHPSSGNCRRLVRDGSLRGDE